MKWASEYDDGDMTMRSRIRHEEWMKVLPCEVLRFQGDISIEKKIKEVLGHDLILDKLIKERMIK